MKKITYFALACALFAGAASVNAQNVTYVEDPTQGYLLNGFSDNWFIQAEGGVGVMMSKYDAKADLMDRLGWKGNLYIGKWFSPVMGLRIGGEFNQMKGMTALSTYNAALGARNWPKDECKDGAVPQKFNNIGAAGDAMLNLTNWILGYTPGRFYNATLYAGASIHWVWAREKTKDASHSTWVNGKTYYANDGDWKYAESRNFSLRAGLLNSFAVCKNFDILLDLRFEEVQEHIDGYSKMWTEYPSVLLGFAYKFEKTGWNAPVVPVCGASSKCSDEECDALVQKLQDANAKIANLERQLRDCLNRKPEIIEAEQEDAPLATIYYPINVSKIVGVQNNVVDAVAEVMLSEDKNYVLTGWADNYTGNDDINTRLRKDRVAGVKNALIKKGVAESRLEAQINNGNLTNFGAKCASLDRAVTIKRAK